MSGSDGAERSATKKRRREILERLNSSEGGLSEETRRQDEKTRRDREYERALEFERGKRHPGF